MKFHTFSLLSVLFFCLHQHENDASSSTTASASSATACADTATNCAQLSNLCNDRTYTLMLEEHCKKTCGRCVGGCQDASTRCAAWNRNGFCRNQYYTNADKRQYCANTCGLCP
ncbi:unnamed protein product [Bursaphelenchus xylophilus]|uniref:(pine wood nematode) hypothetical protein n=1 Tax=Bursaphelenchus xylophilus TaxID=6326 RepID=A0A1I7S5M9_BURXY|nr:unnamed protein product [Bursaphelenchus xylophilus]CAG9124883.1 unnamed protein product [Bursaphelenchus xylophilus]